MAHINIYDGRISVSKTLIKKNLAFPITHFKAFSPMLRTKLQMFQS